MTQATAVYYGGWMSKILSFFKKEIRELIPTTLFFLITFHIIALSRALMLEQYGIKLSTSGTATVGALIVAKVILIFNKFSFVNLFAKKPLFYSIIWKTFIFSLFTLIFLCVERINTPCFKVWKSAQRRSASDP